MTEYQVVKAPRGRKHIKAVWGDTLCGRDVAGWVLTSEDPRSLLRDHQCCATCISLHNKQNPRTSATKQECADALIRSLFDHEGAELFSPYLHAALDHYDQGEYLEATLLLDRYAT